MMSIPALRYGLRLSCTNLRDARRILTKNVQKVRPVVFVHTKPKLDDATVAENSEKQALGKLVGKLKLGFTCKKCDTRNNKLISKLAYEKGVIIVRCDGCKNNHLIADNLGWFSDQKNRINIEKLMAAKGETVRRIQNDEDGYFEAVVAAELEVRQEILEANDEKTDSPAQITESLDKK